MDGNKLKVLQDAGYYIGPACGICEHGVFTGRSMFGTCAVLTYKHAKHTGPERQLSVNQFGRCRADKYKFDASAASALATWLDFLKEEEDDDGKEDVGSTRG